MSGHLRFWHATLLVLAGLSTSPAFSNPFDFLFNAAPAEVTAAAPAEVAAPAPAEQGCLPQPGRSTADGQRWVYHLDGHRKCWFQAAVGATNVKRPVNHPAAKQRVAAREDNEVALRKPTAAVDARAELARPAPVEAPQPTPPEPRVVDVAPDLATGAAALMPPAPIKPATDQLTPDHSTAPQVDVERLLATASSADDNVGLSERPSPRVADPIAETSESEQGWTATWLGVVLMALGLVSLLSASRTIAALVGRLLESEDEPPANRRTSSVRAEEPLRRPRPLQARRVPPRGARAAGAGAARARRLCGP